MEAWCKVWREGVVPNVTTEQLTRLRDALLADDPRLIQGATTTPPPLACVQDWECEAACALGIMALEPSSTVGDVEEFFARLCFKIDEAVEEPAGCRYFLNWFDETPRAEMRQQLLPEVQRALQSRGPESQLQVP